MERLISSSIKSFLEELKKRIELLSSSKVTENIDNANYDLIITKLSLFGITSEEDITEDKIKVINNENLKKILLLADVNQESADYIINHLSQNSFYSKVVDILKKYITDFKSIGSSQTEMINEKVSLYQKYITLFEQEELLTPFEEINEISKIMSEVGLPDQDKWRILEYIALINTKTVHEVDINLSIRIEREYENIKDYITDEIKEELSNVFKEQEIDIDTIPTFAASLASKLGIDANIMNNIVVVSLANNMLERLNKVDKEDDQVEFETIINDILDFIVPIHKSCVYEAIKIKQLTEEFYNNSIQNGISDEMINSYLETPVSLIEEGSIPFEEAIELKELSVLKPLYETLDTLEDIDITSPEYEKATSILSKLVDQYHMLESKKENQTQRIN